jgi:peptide/nickel transport system substrate-binding protein
LKRRTLLVGALGSTLAAPRIARSQTQRVLKFGLSGDLAILDPISNSATPTRNHGYLVFDTLYGLDDTFTPQPQMLAGHGVEDDGRTWTLTLRDGLRFHDDQPVLARDVVASLQRWAKRDGFGATLMAATDTLIAVSDTVLRFRMKQPFPMLPDALGKIPPYMPLIMPERLARTDPFKQAPEIVGSGPYRFVADQYVPGSHLVYEQHAGYVPRANDPARMTAGGKVAHFDRIEWLMMPDSTTAAGALQTGEIDWWDLPTPDLLPVLRRTGKLKIEVIDKTGQIPVLRFNALQPPFDNPAIRRAVLRATDQTELLSAYSQDTTLWRAGMGVFPPGSAMANAAGMDGLFGPSDVARAKRELREAGYRGEPVAMLVASDVDLISAMSEILADLFKRIGMTVDYQATDVGSVFQRRTSKAPVTQGGWSCFVIRFAGADMMNPAVSVLTQGNGEAGYYGWTTSPKLEALRADWLRAGTLAEQQRICEQIQLQVWEDAPYVPLGEVFQPTAYSGDLTGMLDGFPKFYNLRRT